MSSGFYNFIYQERMRPEHTWAAFGLILCLLFVQVGTPYALAEETGAPPPAESSETPPPPPPAETKSQDTTTSETTPPPTDTSTSESGTTEETPPPPPPERTDRHAEQENSSPTDTDGTNGSEGSDTPAGENGDDAATGDNGSTPPGGDASITTGDATAGTNVVNTENTNTVNSELDVLTANSASSTEDVDLRNSAEEFTASSSPDTSSQPDNCDGRHCGRRSQQNLEVVNDNTASTTNAILVSATTGRNIASTSCGASSISTGNAYAGANVVNFVNTNLINSKLLLITINKLGDWLGDLVLPGRQFFENLFADVSSGLGGGSTVTNQNQATISNDVNAGATTGSNVAQGESGAAITTGAATAAVNILNFVNTNIIAAGGISFTLLINFGGNWEGTVFSLPTGASATMENGQLAI